MPRDSCIPWLVQHFRQLWSFESPVSREHASVIAAGVGKRENCPLSNNSEMLPPRSDRCCSWQFFWPQQFVGPRLIQKSRGALGRGGTGNNGEHHSYLITSPRVRVAEEELIIRVVIHHLFNPEDWSISEQKDSENQHQPDPILLLSPLIRGQMGSELEEEEGEGMRERGRGEECAGNEGRSNRGRERKREERLEETGREIGGERKGGAVEERESLRESKRWREAEREFI